MWLRRSICRLLPLRPLSLFIRQLYWHQTHEEGLWEPSASQRSRMCWRIHLQHYQNLVNRKPQIGDKYNFIFEWESWIYSCDPSKSTNMIKVGASLEINSITRDTFQPAPPNSAPTRRSARRSARVYLVERTACPAQPSIMSPLAPVP